MKLGITTIQRDRAPWITEWVTFHYLVGFRKFYIYLHNSSDSTREILNKLAEHIDIQVTKVDSKREWPQLACYIDSYSKNRNDVDWMAFIDADEFLHPTAADDIRETLGEFEDEKISGLGVYWSCFGSSGHINEPAGLLIENYRYRAADQYPNNRHIKSIVRGGQGDRVKPADPHFFQTPNGTYDENLRLITHGWTEYEPTYNKLRVNHYVTQSRSFFLDFKSKIRTPDGSPLRDETWWQEHDRNDVYDVSLDLFVGPLKKILSSL